MFAFKAGRYRPCGILIDARDHSAPRKVASTGTARFTLTFVSRGGAMTFAGESSTVLDRDVRQR